jgi:hypothetical protein
VRGRAGEDEQQIGQAIEIVDRNGADVLLLRERPGALAAGTVRRQVGWRRAPRRPENEVAQWRRRFGRIDGALKASTFVLAAAAERTPPKGRRKSAPSTKRSRWMEGGSSRRDASFGESSEE